MSRNNRVAVIDCGSNTFHLLIAERYDSSLGFREVYRERAFVYLSKSGINEISPSSYALGINTLDRFQQLMIAHKVNLVRCVGTAVLRSSINGAKFISEVKENLRLEIELIDGLEEAALIFNGISLSDLPAGPSLILDIGGGSLELIYGNRNQAVSAVSVNAGISVLRSLRAEIDLLHQSDHNILYNKLTTELEPFISELAMQNPHTLIGASGPFEIIELMNFCTPLSKGNLFSREDVLEICKAICTNDLQGRINLPGMPENRADLSTESMIIIKYLLERLNSLRNILVSPYSLKEGVIKELLNLD